MTRSAHGGSGGTASGRAYIQELIHLRDGSSHVNYAIYHDRYRRTEDGWKFTERVYEIRYLDTHRWRGRVAKEACDARLRADAAAYAAT